MTIRKISANEAKKTKGKTEWGKVDSLTDAEIKKAAKDDSDSALPTEDELKEFKRVKSGKKEN